MAWIKFYPISLRFTRSAFRRKKRVIFSYRGNDYDFETSIIERAKRMGYYYFRPEYKWVSHGIRSLVFEG